jgi:biopolymer transport protein TolQ
MGIHSVVLFGDLARSVPTLVFQSDAFAKLIFFTLFLMSVISWAIIYDRTRLFLKLRRRGRRLQALVATKGLGVSVDTLKQCLPSVEGALVLEAKRYLDARKGTRSTGRDATGAENPAAALQLKDLLERRAVAEVEDMEKYLVYLATTVSVAPFLGLLGTVWGITDSFMSMGSQGTASIEVVGPGIASALIATIAGLAAAIPAVVGYNLLLRHVRRQENGIELFISRILELSGAKASGQADMERETTYEKNPV